MLLIFLMRMGLIKIYFSIVLLIFYVRVEETFADEYINCLSSLNNLFNFQDNIKNAYNCYTFAYYHLNSQTQNDIYGKRYFGYLYGQINDKHTISSPEQFCQVQFPGEKIQAPKTLKKIISNIKRVLNCISILNYSRFNQDTGSSALSFAYTTEWKFTFQENPQDYSYKYFEHLYYESISRLSEIALDPGTWCFSGGYIILSPKQEECLVSLSKLFGPTVDLSNVLDSFTKAFNDVGLGDLDDDFRERYFGYLLFKIKNKRSISSPYKFCSRYGSEVTLDCIEILEQAGFNHYLGNVCLRIAYTSYHKNYFIQNPNYYPGIYFRVIQMESSSKLSEDTLSPQKWCASDGFNRNTAIKLDAPETAMEVGEGSSR